MSGIFRNIKSFTVDHKVSYTADITSVEHSWPQGRGERVGGRPQAPDIHAPLQVQLVGLPRCAGTKKKKNVSVLEWKHFILPTWSHFYKQAGGILEI